MTKIFSTRQALRLANALRDKNIEVITEYWDGHKHIDIFIPSAKLNIEVDGLQHYFRSSQITADFKREYFSTQNGFYTLHIPNFLVKMYLSRVVHAITEVVLKANETSKS
ncbi:MAG: DUF559 domain-containing protein [Bacteroidota bacterium]